MKSAKMYIGAGIAAAAISGFVMGSSVRASVPAAPSGPQTVKKAPTAKLGAKALADDTVKHDCKGKNACKGEGGCKTGDNGCKGKNSCKGKGGCKSEVL